MKKQSWFTAATAFNHPDLFKMVVRISNDDETINCKVVKTTSKTIVVRQINSTSKNVDTEFSISVTSNQVLNRGPWMGQPLFELETVELTMNEKVVNARKIFDAIAGHSFILKSGIHGMNFIFNHESEFGGLQMILPKNKTTADFLTITLDQYGCVNMSFTCGDQQKIIAAFSDVYLDGIIHIIRAVTGIATK